MTSFGGPLALAALMAPGLVADASGAAGLSALTGALLFIAPLAVWLGYARRIGSAGGLFGFVEAAAGRRLALVQAAVWAFSYALYLAYTTVQIVDDLLPAVFAGERRYQSLLTLLIPIALTAVMLAGRTVTLLVIAAIALGQLVLCTVLDTVAMAHLGVRASSFLSGSPVPGFAKASAQTSLLYVCGSLPLFLGGEVANPRRTIGRGLLIAFGLTAVLTIASVAALAGAPGLLRTDIPGLRLAQQYAAPWLADAIGIGVAASTAGVMLCEYLALTRLAHAVGGWRLRPLTALIGLFMIGSAGATLLDPHGVYDALTKPSLVALWISQLIVFVVYPRFARHHRLGRAPVWIITGAASAMAIYGIWTALQQSAS